MHVVQFNQCKWLYTGEQLEEARWLMKTYIYLTSSKDKNSLNGLLFLDKDYKLQEKDMDIV